VNRFARFVASNAWPLSFAVLSAAAFSFSGISISFLLQELVFRVSRYLILALAFLPPALAGAGMNFSMVLGLVAGETAVRFVSCLQVRDSVGVFVSMLLAVPPAAVLGFLGWKADGKARGEGPLVSILLAVFASLLSGFIVGARGSGDAALASGMARGLDGLLALRAGPFAVPAATLLLAAVCAVSVFLIFERGCRDRRASVLAFASSSVLAGLGMIVHLQGLGTLTHGGHGQVVLVSAAAFVAGGAFRAGRKVLGVTVGVLLFQAFYVLAPMASRSVFGSAMLGEHFRFFVACLAVSTAVVRGRVEFVRK